MHRIQYISINDRSLHSTKLFSYIYYTFVTFGYLTRNTERERGTTCSNGLVKYKSRKNAN